MTEEDKAFIIKIVTELGKKDTGIDWTAVGSIGAILAGVAAIWTILANDRPILEIEKIDSSPYRFVFQRTDGDGFVTSPLSLQKVKIANKGSRKAQKIKYHNGKCWTFLDLYPKESKDVNVDISENGRKITYGHWRFSLFRYSVDLSSRTYIGRKKWRSGNLESIEGRKRLRLFMQKVVKESKFSDSIKIKIFKKDNGFIIKAVWYDKNKNINNFSSVFSHEFRDALLCLWPIFKNSDFEKKDWGYTLSIDPLIFRKIYKKHFGFWKFELFSKISYPSSDLNENRIIEEFRYSEGVVRLKDSIEILRSREPNQKYIEFSGHHGIPRNTISFKSRYITEIGRYLLIFESNQDSLLYSTFSFFPTVLTVIDNKHRIIISNELESYAGKKIVLSKEQWGLFKTYVEELQSFIIKPKKLRQHRMRKLTSFIAWVSYIFNPKIQ